MSGKSRRKKKKRKNLPMLKNIALVALVVELSSICAATLFVIATLSGPATFNFV